MTPSRVLDLQGDFLVRMRDSNFQQTLNVPVKAASRAKADSLHVSDQEKEWVAQETTQRFMDGLHAAARTAYAYRVTEDMVDLIVHAANSLDESDEWDPDLAPTGAGFMHFEKPLPVGVFIGVDRKEHIVGADWLIWGPGGQGTMLFFLGDPRRPGGDPWTEVLLNEEEITQEQRDRMLRTIGNWALIGWSSYSRGRSLGPQELEVDDETTPDFDSPGAALAAAIGAGMDQEDRDEDLWVQRHNDARLVHALWLLLNQTIVVTEDEKLDRASRRRAEHMKPPLPARVTTVGLRRRVREERGESVSVDWQHRWIVRGHWAWRRCGEHLDGAQEYDKGWRRRIWISPYEKGPEDKPLVLSEKVYDLRR